MGKILLSLLSLVFNEKSAKYPIKSSSKVDVPYECRPPDPMLPSDIVYPRGKGGTSMNVILLGGARFLRISTTCFGKKLHFDALFRNF